MTQRPAIPRPQRAPRGPAWPRALAAAAVALLAATSAWAQELNTRVERAIAASGIGDARVGVSIIDLATGRVLASRKASTPMLPASNMKLLTSGAALAVLGDEFVFRTELLLDGDRLVLRGSGDPALADPVLLDRMDPPMTVAELLKTLAGAVERAGVRRVSEIVVDDRVFDRERVHPMWPRDQLNRWYCAEVAGVNFHANVLAVFPSPSPHGAGASPRIAIEPEAPWVHVEVRARTVTSGSTSVWLAREPDANRFTFFGEVRSALREPVEVTLHDPPLFTGQLLAATLLGAGIGVGQAAPGEASGARLDAALGAVRLAAPDEAPAAGRPVAAVTTHIRDILERCNGDSQNLYAEALLKRLGHEVTAEPGSWGNGAAAVRMVLSERLGPEHAARTTIDDGSGLSRGNRVAPATLARWLDEVQRDPRLGPAFVNSLPGPTKGSLKRRFQNARLANELRAKTGTIDGVRCLSGYLTNPASGRRLAFSILVNDLRAGEPTLRALELHKDIVLIADEWLASRGSEAIAEPALGG